MREFRGEITGIRTYEFGDNTVFNKVVRLDILNVSDLRHCSFLDFTSAPKPILFLSILVFDYLFDAVKSAAAYKKNICGVNGNKLLMGVLSSALRRNVGNSTLKYLQKRLLNALAGDIACNGRVFALSGYFIYFIDVYYAALGVLNVEIGSLKEAEKNIFNIVAHIACLSERGGVGNGKRYVKKFCQCLCKKRFPAARGAY